MLTLRGLRACALVTPQGVPKVAYWWAHHFFSSTCRQALAQQWRRRHSHAGLRVQDTALRELSPAPQSPSLLLRTRGRSAGATEGGEASVTSPDVGSTRDRVPSPLVGQGRRLLLMNTQTGEKQELRPSQPGRVGMYVCGVTVYDYSHIGHARVYVAFDALYRYLRHLGFDVQYVRNFTDVDDKILKRAAEAGEEPLRLSERFIEEFRLDMLSLGCLAPTAEPKVSEHIPDIVDMIGQIIERGHAYAVEGGDVFFSVPSSPSYGELSGRRLEENRAGERVEVDKRKKHPADFALWKSAKPGEGIGWDSPWGRGRPGWHIECSAMSSRYLGPYLDIHGGGQDLVFPHHENELAQSKAACPTSAVGCWLHNGFVTIDSEKMSKSLGNFFTIREVLQMYHPIALRWFLLSTHYRSPINFSQRQLAEASDRVYYVCQVLVSAHKALASEGPSEKAPATGGLEGPSSTPGGTQPPDSDALSQPGPEPAPAPAPAPRKAKVEKAPQPSKAAQSAAAALSHGAWACLADDFHTGQALAALSEPLRLLSEAAAPKAKKKAVVDTPSIALLLDGVSSVLSVLGFPTAHEECKKLLSEFCSQALQRAGLEEEELRAILQARLQARQEKNFVQSDAIRNELASRGIMLMDGPTGQSWMPSVASAYAADDSNKGSETSTNSGAGMPLQTSA